MQLIYYSWLFLSITFISACAPQIHYQEDISKFRKQIKALQKKILANPQDAKAIADLGIIYFATQDYRRAGGYLRNAFEKDALDPRTAFYTGLAFEFNGRDEIAIAIHSRFREYPEASPYRKLMAGSYRRLFLDKLKRDIDSLLVREKELSNDRVVRSAVAVFPLKYQGVDSQYVQLGYGMSEMISIDLGRVNDLKVLERIRLQALADELNFAQTNLVDQATAPRAGLLLGAGKIISGSFDVLEQKDLQVDLIASDIRRQYASRTASQSDALGQFYRLEKAIVFGIIAEMGIELTQEERDEILRVPTRNILAFMAFCRGLEHESNGSYLQAFRSFENAAKLDPAFKAASEKVEITSAASDVGQRREETFTKAMQQEKLLQAGRDELIADRLRNLGQNIGTAILPGEDKRKAVEEASISGLRELPTPPRPPDREVSGVGNRKN